MGLDMYLDARKYISAYEWETSEKQQLLQNVLGALNYVPSDLDRPSLTVELPVGYWRKANQIHNWFVQNVQDGNDDCKSYYVSRDKLEELSKVCLEVLDNPEKAGELLPTTSGFFFGSTEYDEYYEADLKETVNIIGKCLTDPRLSDCDFSYSSSW